MADFYSVLADAVARLPHNDAQARQDLYARARAIFAQRTHERDTQGLASALEAAIGKVEAEMRARTTAKSLAGILEVLQSDAPPSGGSPASASAPSGVAAAPAAKPFASHVVAGTARLVDPAGQLGGMPNSLGTMLLGIAYAVTAIAFVGVTWIRGAVWLSAGLIDYPAMLAMMTIVLALFVVPPLIVFRRISNAPTIGFLLRFFYLASRRAP